MGKIDKRKSNRSSVSLVHVCVLEEQEHLLFLFAGRVRAAQPVLGDGPGIGRVGGVHSLGLQVHSVIFIYGPQRKQPCS